jgi:hypothetical protein
MDLIPLKEQARNIIADLYKKTYVEERVEELKKHQLYIVKILVEHNSISSYKEVIYVCPDGSRIKQVITTNNSNKTTSTGFSVCAG